MHTKRDESYPVEILIGMKELEDGKNICKKVHSAVEFQR